MDDLALFATAPRGLEAILATELKGLGARRVRPQTAGVSFTGDLEIAYRACLWSRVASRVLLNIARFAAADGDALYAAVRAMPWETHLGPDDTLAVDATVARSSINHSNFAALRIKDAVVDRLRDLHGRRPSVDRERPSLRLNLALHNDRAVLSIDLAGEGMHRRGYREGGAPAPLKENLAAAILLLAGWPERAKEGQPLVDPLCGSGTLAIEAAMIAGDIAPALLREYFGFLGWHGHDAALWASLVDEAQARARREGLPPIVAADRDPLSIKNARAAAAHAGLEAAIDFQVSDFHYGPGQALGPGLVVTNPPYGERLGRPIDAERIYADLGVTLRASYPGWHAAVLSANPHHASRLGSRRDAVRHPLRNGALHCTLTCWTVQSAPVVTPGAAPAPMLADRLRKNLRKLGRWVKREGIDCYRLYDADLPEYSFALDLYRGDRLYVHMQEYAPPPQVDPGRAAERREAALQTVAEVLEVAPDEISFRMRERKRGTDQYQRLAEAATFHEVREGGCRLLVNFDSYLDTGLFLDHRPMRLLIQRQAKGRRFLNLYAYTGTATVHAARGGALSTTSVDLSATYLRWARRNLDLNGFDPADHELLQADCLEWLRQAAQERRRYGLIFIDPPTFSNSKRMTGAFDVQRDHVALLLGAAALLHDRGELYFSTNYRQFKLDEQALEGLVCEEISRQTVAQDFARNPRIHRAWRLTWEGMEAG